MNLLLLRHGYPIAVLNVADRPAYIAALEQAQSTGSHDGLDILVRASVARSLADTLETALSSEEVGISAEIKQEIADWLKWARW